MNLYQTIQSWLVKLVSKMNHRETYSQREAEREAEEYRQWREEYDRAQLNRPPYQPFRPKRKSRSAPTKSTRKVKR